MGVTNGDVRANLDGSHAHPGCGAAYLPQAHSPAAILPRLSLSDFVHPIQQGDEIAGNRDRPEMPLLELVALLERSDDHHPLIQNAWR